MDAFICKNGDMKNLLSQTERNTGPGMSTREIVDNWDVQSKLIVELLPVNVSFSGPVA